jgi:hypothetical protein
MSFKIKITACQECPYYTNSSQEHDDAFTSAPYPVKEWCKLLAEKNHYNHFITDSTEIHKNCPLNK